MLRTSRRTSRRQANAACSSTPLGLYFPARGPQGVLNTNVVFPGCHIRSAGWLLLHGLAGGGIHRGHDEAGLLNMLGSIGEVDLSAVTRKCNFFCEISFTWCGKVFRMAKIRHDRERLSGLADMRRPKTDGELMQFLQAASGYWLRCLEWWRLLHHCVIFWSLTCRDQAGLNAWLQVRPSFRKRGRWSRDSLVFRTGCWWLLR